LFLNNCASLCPEVIFNGTIKLVWPDVLLVWLGEMDYTSWHLPRLPEFGFRLCSSKTVRAVWNSATWRYWKRPAREYLYKHMCLLMTGRLLIWNRILYL